MLEGKLVRLRANEESDMVLFHKFMNDVEVKQYIRNYLPVSMKNQLEWFEKNRNDKSVVNFAIEDRKTRRLIGNCSLMNIDTQNRNAKFGIMIGDKRYWNKGYGTEAGRLILAYGFDTLNLHRIGSGAKGFNERSIRMHEKLGFRKEGVSRQAVYRDGKYWDHVEFGMLRDELKR